MIDLAKRLIFGPSHPEGIKERLTEASQVLHDEADKLSNGVQNLGNKRKDPIDEIIDNIRKVNGKGLNGVGKQRG